MKVKAEPENEDRPIILKKKLSPNTGSNKKAVSKKIKEETLPPVRKINNEKLCKCIIVISLKNLLDSKPFRECVHVSTLRGRKS